MGSRGREGGRVYLEREMMQGGIEGEAGILIGVYLGGIVVGVVCWRVDIIHSCLFFLRSRGNRRQRRSRLPELECAMRIIDTDAVKVPFGVPANAVSLTFSTKACRESSEIRRGC